MNLIGNVVGGLLELLDGLAQTTGKFGYLSGPKKNQSDDHNHHEFAAAKPSCYNCMHKGYYLQEV